MIRCERCEQPVTGWVAYKNGLPVDSFGFMVFGEGQVCDECLTKSTGVHPDTVFSRTPRPETP